MEVNGYEIKPNADLRNADLSGADLSGADLRYAGLREADLSGADLSGAVLPDFQVCPEEGSFIAYKKLSDGVVARVLIPVGAARTSSLVSRKCRASMVRVLDMEDASGIAITGPVAQWKTATYPLYYEPGKTVVADSFDPDIRIDCSHGIHFFMTRKEAKEW
jgi:hypothetical protein